MKSFFNFKKHKKGISALEMKAIEVTQQIIAMILGVPAVELPGMTIKYQEVSSSDRKKQFQIKTTTALPHETLLMAGHVHLAFELAVEKPDASSKRKLVDKWFVVPGFNVVHVTYTFVGITPITSSMHISSGTGLEIYESNIRAQMDFKQIRQFLDIAEKRA
jgi:hypothetical protein